MATPPVVMIDFSGIVPVTASKHSIDGTPNATFGTGFGSMLELKSLNITGNIEYITNETLKIFKNSSLEQLRFQGCQLTNLDKMSFGHLNNHTLLDLSFNQILGFDRISESWYGLQYTSILSINLTMTVNYNRDLIRLEESFYESLEKTGVERMIFDGNNMLTINSQFRVYTPHLKYL